MRRNTRRNRDCALRVRLTALAARQLGIHGIHAVLHLALDQSHKLHRAFYRSTLEALPIHNHSSLFREEEPNAPVQPPAQEKPD